MNIGQGRYSSYTQFTAGEREGLTPGGNAAQQSGSGNRSSEKASQNGTAASSNPKNQKQTAEIQKLKTGEQKVISHETAHKSAGGQYAGAVSYEYKTGPDGKRYIVGGEVSIDMSPAKTPSATVTKMQQVKRAALAPADPSAQDRSVAARADALQQKAAQEAMKQSYKGASKASESGSALSLFA